MTSNNAHQFQADQIGKVVTIMIVLRSSKDAFVKETLETHIGTLQHFLLRNDRVEFQLEGANRQVVNNRVSHVEVYPLDLPKPE